MKSVYFIFVFLPCALISDASAAVEEDNHLRAGEDNLTDAISFMEGAFQSSLTIAGGLWEQLRALDLEKHAYHASKIGSAFMQSAWNDIVSTDASDEDVALARDIDGDISSSFMQETEDARVTEDAWTTAWTSMAEDGEVADVDAKHGGSDPTENADVQPWLGLHRTKNAGSASVEALLPQSFIQTQSVANGRPAQRAIHQGKMKETRVSQRAILQGEPEEARTSKVREADVKPNRAKADAHKEAGGWSAEFFRWRKKAEAESVAAKKVAAIRATKEEAEAEAVKKAAEVKALKAAADYSKAEAAAVKKAATFKAMKAEAEKSEQAYKAAEAKAEATKAEAMHSAVFKAAEEEAVFKAGQASSKTRAVPHRHVLTKDAKPNHAEPIPHQVKNPPKVVPRSHASNAAHHQTFWNHNA